MLYICNAESAWRNHNWSAHIILDMPMNSQDVPGVCGLCLFKMVLDISMNSLDMRLSCAMIFLKCVLSYWGKTIRAGSAQEKHESETNRGVPSLANVSEYFRDAGQWRAIASPMAVPLNWKVWRLNGGKAMAKQTRKQSRQRRAKLSQDELTRNSVVRNRGAQPQPHLKIEKFEEETKTEEEP